VDSPNKYLKPKGSEKQVLIRDNMNRSCRDHKESKTDHISATQNLTSNTTKIKNPQPDSKIKIGEIRINSLDKAKCSDKKVYPN